MNTKTITLNGRDIPYATNLMVAYKVQGMHDHKSYTEVFANIDSMTLEDQIGILYCAITSADATLVNTYPFKTFLNDCLNEMDLSIMMDYLIDIVNGIMGTRLVNAAQGESEENVENAKN